jgi:CHASE3 domain sensor protein
MNLEMKRKVLATLSGVIWLVCLLGIQAGFINWWQTIHDDRDRHAHIKQELLRLERLVMNVDNEFRDYVLMKDSKSLIAMVEAESAIPGIMDRLTTMTDPWPDLKDQVRVLTARVSELLQVKRRLSMDFGQGHEEEVLAYVKRGEGSVLTNTVVLAFRDVERTVDQSDQERTRARNRVRAWTRLALVATTLVTLGVGVNIGRSMRFSSQAIITPGAK